MSAMPVFNGHHGEWKKVEGSIVKQAELCLGIDNAIMLGSTRGGVPVRLITIAFVFTFMCFAIAAQAQDRVTIKEPPEQCYQDLKQALFEVTEWDDRNRVAHGACTNQNNVGMACYTFQVLSEQELDRKKKNPNP